MDPSSFCILERPKYPQNLASAIRACACFGVQALIWTGDRFNLESMERTPRETRMKAYASVRVIRSERPFDLLPSGIVPVCVELLPCSTPLPAFEHPRDAAYIFGPEDGDVSQVFRRFCHQFVHIPSQHCLNLAAAMNVILYDQMCKRTIGA